MPRSRKPMRGDTVVAFQEDGCMGTEHNFQFVGVVKRVGKPEKVQLPSWARTSNYTSVFVQILKRGNLDCRDQDFGQKEILWNSGDLQEIHSGIYLWLR